MSFSTEDPRTQAQKDQDAKDRARKIFLDTGGTESQIKIFEFQRQIKQLRFTLGQLKALGKPSTDIRVLLTKLPLNVNVPATAC